MFGLKYPNALVWKSRFWGLVELILNGTFETTWAQQYLFCSWLVLISCMLFLFPSVVRLRLPNLKKASNPRSSFDPIIIPGPFRSLIKSLPSLDRNILFSAQSYSSALLSLSRPPELPSTPVAWKCSRWCRSVHVMISVGVSALKSYIHLPADFHLSSGSVCPFWKSLGWHNPIRRREESFR